MKESVSEKEVEENDEQVQDFAEDEPTEIYVVPGWWAMPCWRQRDIFTKEKHLKTSQNFNTCL